MPLNKDVPLVKSINVMVCDFQLILGTVGFGGSPDEQGNVSLDAMIMNGRTREVGAVANLKNIREAISVARKISEKTYHSMIVGDDAVEFAKKVGFVENSTRTARSDQIWRNWVENGRKPNYWKTSPDMPKGHDTIGQIAIDKFNNLACGTSTNGLLHKIPGRVGDSPLVGSGAYCENDYGAVSTGQGDIIQRFLPAVKSVMYMKLLGLSPTEAAKKSMKEIEEFHPNTFAAILVLNKKGEYGAWAVGSFINSFVYNVMDENGLHVFNLRNQTLN